MAFLSVQDAIDEGRYVVPRRSPVGGVGQLDISSLVTAVTSIAKTGSEAYANYGKAVASLRKPTIAVPAPKNATAPASGGKAPAGIAVSPTTLVEIGVGVLGLGLLFVILRRK